MHDDRTLNHFCSGNAVTLTHLQPVKYSLMQLIWCVSLSYAGRRAGRFSFRRPLKPFAGKSPTARGQVIIRMEQLAYLGFDE